MKSENSRRQPYDPIDWDLYGWDDGRIYFSSKEGEMCVNDHPELMKKLITAAEKHLGVEGKRNWEAHLNLSQRST
jgi:hypothetical protein